MKYFHISVNRLEPGTILKPLYFQKLVNTFTTDYYDKYYSNPDMALLKKFEQHNQYLKEILFEEIRKNKYPNMPCRMTSIYLFDDLDKIDIFKKKNPYFKDAITYNVELSEVKKLECMDFTFLNCDLREYGEMIESANRYWSGEVIDPNNVEYLCEGKVTILSEI